MLNLPCDDDLEGYGRRVNGELTKVIYTHWQTADLAKPKGFQASRDEMTKLVQDKLSALQDVT